MEKHWLTKQSPDQGCSDLQQAPQGKGALGASREMRENLVNLSLGTVAGSRGLGWEYAEYLYYMPRSVIITFSCFNSLNPNDDPGGGHSYHCTDRETETQNLIPCPWEKKLNSKSEQFNSTASLQATVPWQRSEGEQVGRTPKPWTAPCGPVLEEPGS